MSSKLKLDAAKRFYPCNSFKYIPQDDPLSIINRLFCGWVVRDRFNLLNKYLPFRIVDDCDIVPTAERHELPDLMNQRARELISLNKDIVVSWSGGVDSTGILSALFLNNFDKKRLTVLCSLSARTEYKDLWDWLIKEKINMRVCDYVSSEFNSLRDDQILLTGWCADQLFGSNIFVRYPDTYNLPWIDGLKECMKASKLFLSDKSYTVLEQIYSEYAKTLKIDLKQFCEFAWMYNFCIKYSYVREDAKLSCTDPEVRNRIYNFYDTMKFQEYSMYNFYKIKEVNVNKLNKFYKQPLKQYIYSFTNDDVYLKKKGKVNSWALTSDRRDIDLVSVKDNTGYHVYTTKVKTDNPVALRNEVMKMYLKEEYL